MHFFQQMSVRLWTAREGQLVYRSSVLRKTEVGEEGGVGLGVGEGLKTHSSEPLPSATH